MPSPALRSGLPDLSTQDLISGKPEMGREKVPAGG